MLYFHDCLYFEHNPRLCFCFRKSYRPSAKLRETRHNDRTPADQGRQGHSAAVRHPSQDGTPVRRALRAGYRGHFDNVHVRATGCTGSGSSYGYQYRYLASTGDNILGNLASILGNLGNNLWGSSILGNP